MNVKQEKLIDVKKEDLEERVARGYQMTTVSGFHLDEVISALQKSIRRGYEREALYWTYELTESGFWKYLFRRLSVIACEDVGLADPQTIILVDAVANRLEKQAQHAKERSLTFKPDMNVVGMAVMYLVRAPKNRVVDLATSLIDERRKKGWHLTVPEYCKDQHTAVGRQRNTSEGIEPNKQFYNESALVNNLVSIVGFQEYKDELMKIYGLNELVGKTDSLSTKGK